MAETVLDRKIDPIKALDLRMKGLTYAQIGAVLCPEQPFCKQAIDQALSKFDKFIQDAEHLPAFQQNRLSLLDAVEHRLMDSLLDDDVLAKANLRDRAVSYGIIVDKRRLESGQSTSNIALLSKIVQGSDSDLFTKKAG